MKNRLPGCVLNLNPPVKAFAVSSRDLAKYDNWGVHFHWMLQSARAAANDRVTAFWDFMTQVRKQKRSDIHRIVDQAETEDVALDQIEAIIFPGKQGCRLDATDREALRGTIRIVVDIYLTLQKAEIEKAMKAVKQTEEKFKHEQASS